MIVDVCAAAAEIEAGRVVAYPTETVYGLGADAWSAGALERLRTLKGRGDDKGMSVLVADLDALLAWEPRIPARARALACRFWPGPLTLVVPVGSPAFGEVATPRGVGFRCSSHPTAAALARASRRPVVSTSANRSGEPPCLCADEVASAFGDALPIAGGEPAGGLLPSTVVAVDRSDRLDLLREGALAFSRILEEVEQ